MRSSAYGIALLTLKLAAGGHASIYPTHTYTLPSTIQTGASSMQTNSGQGPLDSPKLDFINATSFDWWYFDVASYNSKASIVLIFYSASDEALSFSGGTPSSPSPTAKINTVSISGSFPNGTLFQMDLVAGDAIVTTVGDASSGNWTGTGASWVGTPDLSSWTVTLDVPKFGFKGEIVYKSTSPAHYFTAPASVLNTSQEAQPNFGWANAVPDSHATVKAIFPGTQLSFSGSGYHDKNWANRPLRQVAASWVWGHASVGSLSIVFWRIISHAGITTNNIYVTRGEKILALGASALTLKSDNSFTVSLDTGYSGRYSFKGVPSLLTYHVPGYNRWVGAITGGLVGGETEGPGPVLWEHIVLN